MACAGEVTPLTLDAALNIAEERNPDLRSAAAALSTVDGELREASALLWNNPEVMAEARERKSESVGAEPVRHRDGSAGIAQTFEIAGQQGYRRAAARDALDAFHLETAARRLGLRLEVERQFVTVLSLQERVALEEEMRRTFEQASLAVQKRVRVGEDSRLDGNLAKVEFERAVNQGASQRELLLDARRALSALLQLDPSQLPQARGSIDPTDTIPALRMLLERAAEQPWLRALAAREASARNHLALERAARAPDVTVGVNYGREKSIDTQDTITTLTLSVPLPLFRRNQGAIGRAATQLSQAQIALESGQRDAQAAIRTLYEKVQNLQDRVDRLRTSAIPALQENRRLSMKALDAGEISLLQLVVVNRQLLDGQRDLLEARTEWRQATIALQAAANALPPDFANLAASRK